MTKPNDQQFQQDPTLTSVSVIYKNPAKALIADDVLPRTPVDDEDFKYQVYEEGEDFTIPDTRVGRRSAPNQVEIGGSDKTASTDDYGIDIPLDNKTIKKAKKKGWDPEKRATMRSTDIILLDREVRAARLVGDPAIYHEDNKRVLSAAEKLTNSDSDPLNMILDMMNECWMRPNQICFNTASWLAFRQHPAIVSAVYKNDGKSGAISREAAAELLEVNKILVGDARHNINRPGQTPVVERAWGPHIYGQYIDENADQNGGVTFGFTAQDGTRIAGRKPTDMGLQGGVLIRAGESVKELIIANRAGFLLEDAV